MKKIIISIGLLITILMGLKIEVYAATYTDQFYLSDYIENVYYAKNKNGAIYYRNGRITKRRSDDNIVYCIQPFTDLKEDIDYTGYDYNYEELLNTTTEKWERIQLLAYYGYGYGEHTDPKWYSITQIMIWETIDETSRFYWTDTFKGDEITKFTEEKEELDNLVEKHNIKPSFNASTFDMSVSSEITITDTNNVLENYELKEENENIKIQGNTLIYQSTENEETINIELVRKRNIYQSIPIIYVDSKYQNVLSIGSYDTISANLTINIESGSLKIIKQDSETQSINPQGEASLIGTTYELFDDKNNLIDELIIGEDSTTSINNLKYGNYILKEKNSGIGYQLDSNEYHFSITNQNKNIELVLNNQVIKSKIRLYKYYQSEKTTKESEKNIKFQIINNKGEIYKEVTTDENGFIEFELPYGTYTITQVNTTDGYYKVDDFTITIDETTEDIIEYSLTDLKVPNTNQTNYNMTIIGVLITNVLFLIFKLKHEEKYS